MGFATSAPTSSGTVRASSPACDSRGILIVESVIVHPGDDARRTIGAALDRNPGAEFTTPGACPSLRAHVDGGDVYAVYVDYGRDTGSVARRRREHRRQRPGAEQPQRVPQPLLTRPPPIPGRSA